MFTNEVGWDRTVTTVMDESGANSDVRLIIKDSGVMIHQYDEEGDEEDTIFMTHKMFKDLIEALNHEEGFYKTKYNKQ